jgi:hypothetical protein
MTFTTAGSATCPTASCSIPDFSIPPIEVTQPIYFLIAPGGQVGYGLTSPLIQENTTRAGDDFVTTITLNNSLLGQEVKSTLNGHVNGDKITGTLSSNYSAPYSDMIITVTQAGTFEATRTSTLPADAQIEQSTPTSGSIAECVEKAKAARGTGGQGNTGGTAGVSNTSTGGTTS